MGFFLGGGTHPYFECQGHEKCIDINLTQSCKSSRLKLSFGFREIIIRVDLIKSLRVESAKKNMTSK